MFIVNLIVNNVSYLCEEGSQLSIEGNETLDSASVVIKGLYPQTISGVTKWYQDGVAGEKAPLDLQPLDKVQLVVMQDNTQVYNNTFCVDSWQRITAKQQNRDIYNYSITLASETKRLEGIPLPNLVITNANKAQPLTIYQYLQRYAQVYGLPYDIELDNISYWTAYGFTTTQCPDMTWNEPTFRELLNDLCLLKDCIVTLKSGKIRPMSIGQRGSTFTSNKILFVNQSQSLSEYASETHSTLTNAIDIDDSINNRYITYRNDNVAYFSETANGGIKIRTDRPIVEIKSFKINILAKRIYEGGGE